MEQSQEITPRLLNATTLSAYLGCNIRTAGALLKSTGFPAVQLSDRVRVTSTVAVDRWLESMGGAALQTGRKEK